MTITTGKTTSEHWRAMRAEIAGGVLVLVGVVLMCCGEVWPGVALAAIGGALAALVAATYARARSEVKAAAVRRPTDFAPKRI